MPAKKIVDDVDDDKYPPEDNCLRLLQLDYVVDNDSVPAKLI